MSTPTSATSPAPPPFQPQSKASATAQLVKPRAATERSSTPRPATTGPQAARGTPSAYTKASRGSVAGYRDGAPTNSAAAAASPAATLALIKRVLAPAGATENNASMPAPKNPVDLGLPPLTSSNEVDLQLYGILAVIIKDFVNTWYGKITNDREFVGEVVQIIAHCCRAIEERLRNVDVVEMILDECAYLVQRHIDAYRISVASAAELSHGYGNDVRCIYHSLNPHPALSPPPNEDVQDPDAQTTQAENEAAYRQLLIQGTLAVLLPTEDLQNAPLRILVTDIIADLIIGQAVAGKLMEGWFIQQTIAKLLFPNISVDGSKSTSSSGPENDRGKDKMLPRPKTTATTTSSTTKTSSASQVHQSRDSSNLPQSRLEKFGLLPSNPSSEISHSSALSQSAISVYFWRIMQYGYLTYLFMFHIIKGLGRARQEGRDAYAKRGHHRRHRESHARAPDSSPALASKITTLTDDPSETNKSVHLQEQPSRPASTVMVDETPPVPVLAYGIYGAVASLLNLDMHMPWLRSMFLWWQKWLLLGPFGSLAAANSILDRFLHHAITDNFLPPSLVPTVLLALRVNLFPNNSVGPPAPSPPSTTQLGAIKREAAQAILATCPGVVTERFYATSNVDELAREVEQDILAPFEDAYLNKHLLYSILELVLVGLVPELAKQDIGDLLAERGDL